MIKVTRRERKLKNSIALYLDYYVNGERRQESTNLHIYPQKDEQTRQLNRENNIRFEKLRVERQTQLLNGIAPLPVNHKKADFFKYYEDFFIKFPTKERRATAVLKKLKEFHGKKKLPVSLIDEAFLRRFQTFLDERLNGETPHNYFKLLRKVIRYATKERLFLTDPSDGVKMRKKQGKSKDILTYDEIRALVKSECSNREIKRAFLFTCFTGLRYCDVSKLKWSDIVDDKVSIKQSKTGDVVEVVLHDNALNILPNRASNDELVFQLPKSLNGCNKVLASWVKSSGINKHITWHCGRHSFATNMILFGADIVSTSNLLGHKSLKHTQRYVKIAESMKRNAINMLPRI